MTTSRVLRRLSDFKQRSSRALAPQLIDRGIGSFDVAKQPLPLIEACPWSAAVNDGAGALHAGTACARQAT